MQNLYNLAHRDDDALIDHLAIEGIAYVPFFPLGGFTPLQSSTLSDVAARLGATPMQVALAWLLRRAPNILLIPGTSSLDHLRENLAAAQLALPEAVLRRTRHDRPAQPIGDLTMRRRAWTVLVYTCHTGAQAPPRPGAMPFRYSAYL